MSSVILADRPLYLFVKDHPPQILAITNTYPSPFIQSNSTGHLILIRLPYLQKPHGTGVIANAWNPRRPFPHPIPNFSYISSPANGNSVPKIDLGNVVTAIADAT